MSHVECGGILQENNKLDAANKYFVRKERNCFIYNAQKQNIEYMSYVRPMNCTERSVTICIEIKIAATHSSAGGDKINYKISNVIKMPAGCPPMPVLSEGLLLKENGHHDERCVQLKLQEDPLVEVRATGSDGVSKKWFNFNC